MGSEYGNRKKFTHETLTVIFHSPWLRSDAMLCFSPFLLVCPVKCIYLKCVIWGKCVCVSLRVHTFIMLMYQFRYSLPSITTCNKGRATVLKLDTGFKLDYVFKDCNQARIYFWLELACYIVFKETC